MTRRSFHVILIGVVMLLSIGEAYHYHPDGGKSWSFVALPFTSSSSTTDSSDSEGQAASSGSHDCVLHFWSSLLSTSSIVVAFVLAPPVRVTALYEHTSICIPSREQLTFSARAPPTILF